ncbi:ABC transporter [Acuticoccus sediminis]|uniref:ABC transporter n=1 Tax=Acuticoccus sediminis TaxID=2184697 RepID=A0A8B2NU80_9HYPH|nr:ATP-binding cassette domain-containing protein [Acuticoccus sediminis]RAH99889.1 ABC transporter [Acuticoccus sediminis]
MTLEARDVDVVRGGRAVLSGVNLTLRPGEFVGLIGPNGAGKSSLVEVLAGLARPARGVVAIDGRPLCALRPRMLARTVAYLAQGATIDWPIRVAEVVALGRLPHGERAGAVSAAVDRAMAAADVLALAGRRADALSGGERMRVLLARALAVEAPFLFADEPLTALDPFHQLHAMELLRRTARGGAAVTVVLHDLALATRFCDRVVLLSDGGVAADGPPETVLTDARIAAAYGVSVVRGAVGDERYILPWAPTPTPTTGKG